MKPELSIQRAVRVEEHPLNRRANGFSGHQLHAHF